MDNEIQSLAEVMQAINDLLKRVEILENNKGNAQPVMEYRGVRERLMDAQKEARTRKEKFDERQLQ